jgi:hypothetical protein
MDSTEESRRKKLPGWAPIVIILVVAWMHGLIYIWLMPPWQHYDEQNHFEYAWLVANWKKIPHTGDSDPVLSRQVLDSMWNNGFFGDPINKPDIQADQPITVPGFPQFDDPPLYYIITAVPLMLTSSQSVEVQLYAGRFVSLCMLLLTVLAAWGIAREITPENSPLRWVLPLTLALFPSFVDLMTAINNDAGGIALFSMFLWASVRLIQRGFNWLTFLWATAMAALTFFTRNTAMPAIIFLPLVLLLSLIKGRGRWLVWVAVVVGSVALLGFLLQRGDAALWYRSTSQDGFTREENSSAVLGSHVIKLDTSAPVTPGWMTPLFQPITSWEPRIDLGNNLTMGLWMWADRPVEAHLPALYINDQPIYTKPVQLETTPKFFAYPVPLPATPRIRMWVNLEQPYQVMQKGATLYYDGVVLARGKRSLEEPPIFDDAGGTRGTWQGESFKNLIRNGSAEAAGLRIRPAIDQLGTRLLPDNIRLSFLLTSFLDYSKFQKLMGLTWQRLFRTFWGSFGWGNVQLIGSKPYRLVGVLTLLGALGYILWLIQMMRTKRREIPVHSILLFAATILFVWFVTVNRGLIYFSKPKILLPVARYTFPTLIPVLYFLVTGWVAILYGIAKPLRIKTIIPDIFYIAMLLVFDVYAIVSIYQFYSIS